MIAKSAAGDGLGRIDELTAVAVAQRDLDDILREMLDETMRLLRADTATILLLDRAAKQLFATISRGLEDEIVHGLRIPLGSGFSGRVASERAPRVLSKVDATTVTSAILLRSGVRALLGVPMLVDGDLVGVLHVGVRTFRRFTEEDIALLRSIAERIAPVSQERLSQSERTATLVLQRSLLPTQLPELADLEMAARYLPGHRLGVGGDWYDVFVLPTGAVGVVVGDVSGHGLQAAVVMGRLRSALRAYAIECDDPADALTRLDEKSRYFEAGSLSTILYAMVSPAHDQVSFSLAGHLPPVLAVPGDVGRLLDAPVDPPIGLPRRLTKGADRRTTAVEMSEGAVFVFYTDGLVERRQLSLDEGLDRLCSVTKADAVDTVCAVIMDTLGIDDAADDIAVLAMRRIGGPAAS